MKNRVIVIVAFFLLIFASGFWFGCNPEKQDPMKIAVTKASTNYINWLKKGDTSLVLVDMYPLGVDSALEELSYCSGLLVTGGDDVQPAYYGKTSEKNLCKDLDPRRDTLEIALIKKALAMKMPVLGICRGEQILNVALGGSLIVDIPAHFEHLPRIHQIVHQCGNYLKCFHAVNIFPNTLLHSITGCDTGFVTTNHHQAIDRLATGLVCNARSKDGLIEGIEWEIPEGNSFLIGVQWHPERMDTSNCLSGKLVKEFLLKSKEFKESKN